MGPMWIKGIEACSHLYLVRGFVAVATPCRCTGAASRKQDKSASASPAKNMKKEQRQYIEQQQRQPQQQHVQQVTTITLCEQHADATTISSTRSSRNNKNNDVFHIISINLLHDLLHQNPTTSSRLFFFVLTLTMTALYYAKFVFRNCVLFV